MSIRNLKTFLTIAESGSFAAAARTIHRTQSAITAQMQSLEEDLGFIIFDRSKRPPILSEAGRGLVSRVAEIVEVYDQLFRDGARSGGEGRLRLGVVPSVITGMMPKALIALRAKYPGLHIDLTMGLSKDLVERVQRGMLDAAILSDLLEGGSGLQWWPFAQETLVLIAPLDAPGQSAEKLLSSYPFIRYTRQAWVGQIIDRFLKQRRLHVNEAMTLDTLEAITTMVHYGLGVSIVPLRITGEPFSLPVRSVGFSGKPAYRVIGLLHASDHAKAGLAEALLNELKEQVQQVKPLPYVRSKARIAPQKRRRSKS